MADSAAHTPAPTASGTLARTPFVHLLLYVLEKKLTGTLELQVPGGRAATIALVEGRPAKVRTSEPVAHLGRVLLELGHLDEERLTRSLTDLAKEKASGRRLHGEVLRAQGVVDEAQLAEGLEAQVGRKLRHVAGMAPETTYAYFDGFDALGDWGAPAVRGVDPFPGLWAMVRESPSWEHVSATLARVGASALRLRAPDLARLRLGTDELTVLELMRSRPLRVDEVARLGHLDDRTGQLLVYLLVVTKQVEILPPAALQSSQPPPSPRRAPTTSPNPPLTKPPPPAGVQTAAPRPPSSTNTASVPVLAAPSGLAPDLAARWTEIAERAAIIDRTDYFSMLDLARDAQSDDVERAFVALAKQWHPDRLPPELAPVRAACSRVFARMSEARATLVDEAQRGSYMKLLAEGSGTPEAQETVAKVIGAVTSFQKAEICFRRNDLVQAETHCRRAIELDETQADYHALLAWLVAMKPENQSPEGTLVCIRMLDRAVSMSNKCEKAHFWRGMLFKRLGKGDLAARDFRRVVELNPRNIEAVREIRLHTMRTGGLPGEGATDEASATTIKAGLLDRFFKKS